MFLRLCGRTGPGLAEVDGCGVDGCGVDGCGVEDRVHLAAVRLRVGC